MSLSSEKLTGRDEQATIRVAIEEDHETSRQRWLVVACTIVALMLLSCVTYCGVQPKLVDQEAEAERRAEVVQSVACVRSGGSWMPVRREGSTTPFQMSCVTAQTLPLVTKMNEKDD